MNFRHRIVRMHPAALVLAGFLAAIAAGTLLLKLPAASQSGYIAWMDALFTATSAVCVTGLVVVDTGSHFSMFGQSIILFLIQIGGLGVMTISVGMFRWIGRMISFRQRMAMQDLLSHTPREDIFGLVKSVFLFTIAAEAVGALLLTVHWSRELSLGSAVYTAVFHSVSAFCNAGFALFSDSMTRYGGDLLLNVVMCVLIVAGGIGFPVLYDLRSWMTEGRIKRQRLSVQTRVVLLTTLFLIAGGALLFAFLERESLAASGSMSHRILAPLFQSITCRTAGFNTVDIASLKDATLAVFLFLMFFGASPGSCGGGVKTTTLALLAVFTVSRIRGRHRVNLFRKTIPVETVTRSVSLILVSLTIIGVVLFMLLLGDSASGHNLSCPKGAFLTYLFETVSAFGTVGLSMGATPELDTWGKFWIIFMMIVGRVGVLTFSYVIVGAGMSVEVEYAEENMMIG